MYCDIDLDGSAVSWDLDYSMYLRKKNRKHKHKIGAYLKQIIIDIVIALVVLLQRKRVFTTNDFESRFQS